MADFSIWHCHIHLHEFQFYICTDRCMYRLILLAKNALHSFSVHVHHCIYIRISWNKRLILCTLLLHIALQLTLELVFGLNSTVVYCWRRCLILCVSGIYLLLHTWFPSWPVSLVYFVFDSWVNLLPKTLHVPFVLTILALILTIRSSFGLNSEIFPTHLTLKYVKSVHVYIYIYMLCMVGGCLCYWVGFLSSFFSLFVYAFC